MLLTYRPATREDLIACLDTLRHQYGDDPEVIPHLPAVWSRLLASGIGTWCVLEDRTQPWPARLLSLGATVFVTDAFAEEAKAGGVPYVSAQIVRHILRGDFPVLDREATRRAHRADGLNLCVLHNDHRGPTWNIDLDGIAREKHLEMFFHFHRGYHVKEYLQEVYGEATVA